MQIKKEREDHDIVILAEQNIKKRHHGKGGNLIMLEAMIHMKVCQLLVFIYLVTQQYFH